MLWLWLLDEPKGGEHSEAVWLFKKTKADMSPQTCDNGSCQRRLAAEDDSRAHSALNVHVLKWDKVLAAGYFCCVSCSSEVCGNVVIQNIAQCHFFSVCKNAKRRHRKPADVFNVHVALWEQSVCHHGVWIERHYFSFSHVIQCRPHIVSFRGKRKDEVR